MAKLLLIEGIPGSGKTTSSNYICNQLVERGFNVKKYNEGELHPCDLAWHAIIPKGEFDTLLEKYPQFKAKLLEQSIIENDKVIVAYTQLGLPPYEPLVQLLEKYEIYQGNVDLETFKNEHFRRWRTLNDESDRIYIFECAYLQNHITELILSYEQDKSYILKYLIKLLNLVNHLNPTLIYLNPHNPNETLDYVIKERVSDDPNFPDWIELVVEFIKNSSYGKNNRVETIDDCRKFFEYRINIEHELLSMLSSNSITINYNSSNWAQLEEKLVEVVNKI